jgi:eukaryotic-like serine/threonine-protein kinase
VSSWVVTDRAIRKIIDDVTYLNFVNSIFTTHTVIFVGISADDVASGGILHRLVSKGIDPGNHFWITSRSDPETDNWAEHNNVLAIRYPSEGGHDAPLDAAINFLRDFKSVDEPLPPVVTTSYGVSQSIEAPAELEKLSPNEIRFKLNAYAARFVSATGQTFDVDGYNDFLKKYRFTLHKAWYVDPEEPYNQFFDYRILGRLGTGLFGTVYKAEASDGTLRAIKILRSEVMTNDVMLQCFRRGATSMTILERSDVSGVVKLYEAMELPPAIIMEFVEGGNLEEATPAGLLNGWPEALSICHDVAGIVRSGHLLSERVLHRDIRPANIMLRDLYTTDQRKVVVLDFDLSWHIGAVGNTIAPHAMQAMAYLSPEQRTSTGNAASRNATVDSFGLAMTLYYLLTGLAPGLGEHRDQDWQNVIYNRLSQNGSKPWTSVRRRVARLIASATSTAQNQRPDMGELEFELSRLHQCLTQQDHIDSAELIAEQIAFEAFTDNYEWDEDRLIARRKMASGTEFTIRSINDDKAIELTITYSAQGFEARKNVIKYLAKACDQAKKILRSDAWKIELDQLDSYSARVIAKTPAVCNQGVHRRWAKMISEIEALSYLIEYCRRKCLI